MYQENVFRSRNLLLCRDLAAALAGTDFATLGLIGRIRTLSVHSCTRRVAHTVHWFLWRLGF